MPPDSDVAGIVDRFLARKRGAASTSTAPEPAPAPAHTAADAVEQPAPAKAPASPPPEISPFVCEDDVRDAIRANRKIYIGPRSIVTPSARDLANQHDVLVMAERDPAKR
jgi:hypothetical protein